MPNAANDRKQEIKVGIAEWKVDGEPTRIITLGLGSCVGIAVYDQVLKIGGLAHIMLPDSSQFPGQSNPAKFADLAVPMMWEELQRRGARAKQATVKIAGGAQMFSFSGRELPSLNIGQRNVVTVKATLQRLGLRLVGEETGGNRGRTVILDLNNGQVTIRVVGAPPIIL